MFYSIIDLHSQLCYFLNMKKKTIFDLFEEQQEEKAKQLPANDRMPGEEPAQEEPEAEEAAEEPEAAEPEQQTEGGADDGL